SAVASRSWGWQNGRRSCRRATTGAARHRLIGTKLSRKSWASCARCIASRCARCREAERFCQEDRVRIRQPHRNLQTKFVRPLSSQNEFVAYIDAIGRLDNQRCLLEWKTTSARYPTEPDGLLALDPQLICYSWITGISEVAQVVFVRKRLVEIQYLRTSINDEQRREFGQLVEASIRQIESA